MGALQFIRWAFLIPLAIALAGCNGTLFVDGEEVTGDDDDVADDDTADDDTADDDDDVTDDDDVEPDFSAWTGTWLFHVDFSAEAEEWWGAEDCTAPYELVGFNASGGNEELCPSCDHIFLLSHNPDPPDEVEKCVSQLQWETNSFERLYGIEFDGSEAGFILWRNFGDPDSELTEYGYGELDGAEFWFDSNPQEDWMYTSTAEGDGYFGP